MLKDAEDTEDAEDADEEIDVDLTVFGTGIPTFDFIPVPRRTVRVPARNHRQSPMFVFGANTVASASAFEIPTVFTPIGPREELQASLPSAPPSIEMTRTPVELIDSFQESDFEWTPINLEESSTMTPHGPPASQTSTEESITDE